MRFCLLTLLCAFSFSSVAVAQDDPIEQALIRRLIDPELPLKEVQEFTERRILPVPEFESVAQWEKFAKQTRKDLLEKVVLRGEAAKWAEAKTEAVRLDTIEMDDYRIHKLRFEAVPGLWIPALLYEPKEINGKVPVVLNVNGHDGNGKAADYKQTRCINQAKRGMLALNLEWVGMGQLRSDGFNHYKMNQLDLCGTSGLAIHYLSQKRGLDLLLSHPKADPERVAVAGLSGGGWQTIFISALDERVTLSNPVAGYSSFTTRARYQSDLGDSEQTPSDLATVADYALLTAMRAPHATLLTNNAQDQCCFKAEHAQPPLVEAAAPIYELYGRSAWLRTHVNHVPGNHNFEQDNREQLYRMFGDYFFGGLQTVFVKLDQSQLKKQNLTTEQVRDALGKFATIYTDNPDSEATKLWQQTKADNKSAPDLVVLLSRHFRNETLDSLAEKQITAGDHKVSLKELAELITAPTANFDADFSAAEIACADEIKTAEELNVALPEENLDFHQLAVSLSQEKPAQKEISLKDLVSAHDWEVHALLEKEEQSGDLTIRYWWLRIGGLWTVPATEFIPINADETCVLICAEQGRGKLAPQVKQQLDLSHRVVAFDPFYFGESTISKRDFLYGLLVATTGERNLGIQASQIRAIAGWARAELPDVKVELLAVGPRMSLAALTAAALAPKSLNRLTLQNSYQSLREVIEQDIAVNAAPELFVFGMLPAWDIPKLKAVCEEQGLKVVTE